MGATSPLGVVAVFARGERLRGEALAGQVIADTLRTRPGDVVLGDLALRLAFLEGRPERVVTTVRTLLADCGEGCFDVRPLLAGLAALREEARHALSRQLIAVFQEAGAIDLERRFLGILRSREGTSPFLDERLFRLSLAEKNCYGTALHGTHCLTLDRYNGRILPDLKQAAACLMSSTDERGEAENLCFLLEACGAWVLDHLEPEKIERALAAFFRLGLDEHCSLSGESLHALLAACMGFGDEALQAECLALIGRRSSDFERRLAACELALHRGQLRGPLPGIEGLERPLRCGSLPPLRLAYLGWRLTGRVDEALADALRGCSTLPNVAVLFGKSALLGWGDAAGFWREVLLPLQDDDLFLEKVVLARCELGLWEGLGEPTEALEALKEGGPERRPEGVAALLGQLSAGEGLETAVAFCEEEGAALLERPGTARAMAETLMRARRWSDAARAWVAAEHPGDPAWPIANAYRAHARARDLPGCQAVRARIDLKRAAFVPVLPMLAHSACLVGDVAFAGEVVARAEGCRERFTEAQRDDLLAAEVAVSGRLPFLEDDGREPLDADALRYLILDPGFNYVAGHQYNYSKFALDFFETDLGLPRTAFSLLVSGTAGQLDPSLRGYAVKRRFRFYPYCFRDVAMSLEVIEKVNEAFYLDLMAALPRKKLGDCTLIYFHSMKSSMIWGFSRWCRKTFHDRKVTIVIGVIEIDHVIKTATIRNAAAKMFRRGFATLLDCPNVELVVYAETEQACKNMTHLTNYRYQVRRFPYLAASLAGGAGRAKRPLADAPVTFGVLGSTSADRGSDLFPEIVERTAALPGVRWLLQLRRSTIDAMGRDNLSVLERAVAAGRCEWHEERLDDSEYFRLFRRLDVIVLPYRERYAVSGSGVFTEALELRRLVIAPEKTFMGKLLKELDYPCVLLPEVSAAAVEAAVGEVLERREHYRRALEVYGEEAPGESGRARFRALVEEAMRRSAGAA